MDAGGSWSSLPANLGKVILHLGASVQSELEKDNQRARWAPVSLLYSTLSDKHCLFCVSVHSVR